MTKNFEVTKGIATASKGEDEDYTSQQISGLGGDGRTVGVDAGLASLLDLLRTSVKSSARRPISSDRPGSGSKQRARNGRRSPPHSVPIGRARPLPDVVADRICSARIGVRHDDLYLARMFLVPGLQAKARCRDVIDLLGSEVRGWNAIFVLACDGEIELIGSVRLSENTWILRRS